MIDNAFVIDATVHGGHFHPRNFINPLLERLNRLLYHWGNHMLPPIGDEKYKLSYQQFIDRFESGPDVLEHALFGESDVDAALYQVVPLYSLYKDGSSPLSIAQAIAKRYPHRLFIYGDLAVRMEDPIRHIDSLIDDAGVIGFKTYPLDLIDGRIVENRLDDEKLMFPLFDHLVKRGIKVVAVHKAVPLPPDLINRYHLEDMEPAIKAFPGLTFEIVHGGFAFTEETADLLDRYPNVTVNLESTPCFSLNFKEKFADMIAPLLVTGADRLFFSTGAPIMHPDPYVRSFWDYEMPTGYPALTKEIKTGILGGNFARFHGLNLEALKSKCRADRYGLESKRKAAPWSVIHERGVKAVA
jgi:predicted TIM-barrel fold metal-dependent hydrolase